MAGSGNIAALVAWVAVFVVFSYAVCGIPFGLLIARAMGHIDVRSTGSGNIGTTNVARSVGKAAAGLTLLCDLGKGLACMLFARFMLSLLVYGTTGFAGQLTSGEGLVAMSAVFDACVFGHIFSPYLNFRGGKGIAVGFGAALGLWWPVGLGLAVVFAIFAVPSRFVSLGSILAAVSLPIQCLAWGFDPWASAIVALAAVVVVWAHRGNIAKLARGEERRFGFHKEGEGIERAEGFSPATDPEAAASASEGQVAADVAPVSAENVDLTRLIVEVEGEGEDTDFGESREKDAVVGAHFAESVSHDAQADDIADAPATDGRAEGDAR